jgi:hypothetical protein
MARRGGKAEDAKDTLVHIDPAKVRFTHSRIRPFFSGCGRRVEDTLADILEGRIRFEDLPFITVVAMDGDDVYFSLNNRRLWVIKQLKARGFLETVPVRIKPAAESRKLREKYTIERCSETAKFLYEVGSGRGEAGAGAEAEDVDDEEEEEDEGEAGSSAADDRKRSEGSGNRNRKQQQTQQQQPQQKQEQEEEAETKPEAPVITATAKPKRRADKKAKASRQQAGEGRRDPSAASVVVHVSSELLGRQLDFPIEPHVCVAEFIR